MAAAEPIPPFDPTSFGASSPEEATEIRKLLAEELALAGSTTADLEAELLLQAIEQLAEDGPRIVAGLAEALDGHPHRSLAVHAAAREVSIAYSRAVGEMRQLAVDTHRVRAGELAFDDAPGNLTSVDIVQHQARILAGAMFYDATVGPKEWLEWDPAPDDMALLPVAVEEGVQLVAKLIPLEWWDGTALGRFFSFYLRQSTVPA